MQCFHNRQTFVSTRKAERATKKMQRIFKLSSKRDESFNNFAKPHERHRALHRFFCSGLDCCDDTMLLKDVKHRLTSAQNPSRQLLPYKFRGRGVHRLWDIVPALQECNPSRWDLR